MQTKTGFEHEPVAFRLLRKPDAVVERMTRMHMVSGQHPALTVSCLIPQATESSYKTASELGGRPAPVWRPELMKAASAVTLTFFVHVHCFIFL